MITWHRYVRVHLVDDYLRIGWMALPSFAEVNHGNWSVHCVWLCGCKMVEPR